MANNNNKKSIKIWWLISSFFCVSKKEQKKKFQIFLAFQKKCRKDNDKINFHITQSSAMKYWNTGNQTFPFPWHYVNAHHHHWSFIYLCWIEKINFHNENIFQVKKIDCIHHIKINSSQFNFFWLKCEWKILFFRKKIHWTFSCWCWSWWAMKFILKTKTYPSSLLDDWIQDFFSHLCNRF